MNGVIFDFNGTMFFDSDKHEKAWDIYLKNLCKRKITKEEFKEFVHGRNSSFIIEHFTGRKLSKDTLMKMSDEKEAVYRDLCLKDMNNFCLVKGLGEFLNYLKKENIKVNIATASNKDNIDFYFERFNLGKWFDYNKVVYDNGTLPGKPSPYIYLKAADNIGINPRDCVVFEDAISGVKSAYNGGFGKIVVIAGEKDKDYFYDTGMVDKVISDFTDLKHYIY